MNVRVSWNRGKGCWSVKVPGEPMQYVNSLCLHDCRFVINHADRKKELLTGVPLVHAFLEGKWDEEAWEVEGHWEVHYRPQWDTCFVLRNHPSKLGWPLFRSPEVLLRADGKILALLP